MYILVVIGIFTLFAGLVVCLFVLAYVSKKFKYCLRPVYPPPGPMGPMGPMGPAGPDGEKITSSCPNSQCELPKTEQ